MVHGEILQHSFINVAEIFLNVRPFHLLAAPAMMSCHPKRCRSWLCRLTASSVNSSPRTSSMVGGYLPEFLFLAVHTCAFKQGKIIPPDSQKLVFTVRLKVPDQGFDVELLGYHPKGFHRAFQRYTMHSSLVANTANPSRY